MAEPKLKPIALASLRRLPAYHHFLKNLQAKGTPFVSSILIGRELRLDPTQVRKDLEITEITGRPKVGYPVAGLIRAIEEFLGWNNSHDAFLAGAGSLGRALLGYEKFRQCGLNIMAAFDTDPAKIGTEVAGRHVLPLEMLPGLARRMNIHIGIVTVPAAAAQDVAGLMVDGGILAIWNFAPVSLSLPERIIVQNEDLYRSLAGLSFRLAQRLLEHPVEPPPLPLPPDSFLGAEI